MKVNDRASGAAGSHHHGAQLLNTYVHPINRLLPYSAQQAARVYHEPQLQKQNSSMRLAVGQVPPSTFLWQQRHRLGPDVHQAQQQANGTSAARLSSRLPVCRIPTQGQSLMVRMLPNAGVPENHRVHPGLAVRGAVSSCTSHLVVPGSASRSHSRGHLHASGQNVDSGPFRILTPQSPQVTLPSHEFHHPFPHGLPTGLHGAGRPQLVFKARESKRTILRSQQQYSLQPRHPSPNPHKEQQQAPQPLPSEMHQQKHAQTSASFSQTQTLEKPSPTQSDTDSMRTTSQVLYQHDMQHHELQYAASKQHGGCEELHSAPQQLSPSEPPTPPRFPAIRAIAHPEVLESSDEAGKAPNTTEIPHMREENTQSSCQSTAEASNKISRLGRRQENANLWTVSEDVASTLPSFVGRPNRGTWSRSSAGGPLLRSTGAKDSVSRYAQKSSSLRSASAQPVPVRPSPDYHIHCEERIHAPEASESSPNSVIIRSELEVQEEAYQCTTESTPKVESQVGSLFSNNEPDELDRVDLGKRDASVGEEASTCSVTGFHQNSETQDSLEASLHGNDSSTDDDADQQGQEVERYIKVLVPGYLRWREKQCRSVSSEGDSANLDVGAEHDACLWDDDLVIYTSRKGMGREIVVNTKQCRAERPLINTCVERLGWTRDDQTDNKGNIIWLGGSVPDHDHLHFMRNAQDLFPDLYDFSPPCWSFPEDRARIEQILHPRNVDTYIIKPDGGAKGSGIQLVSRYRDIDGVILRGEGNYVMQKYIDKPRLLNRRKFDLRVYAAVYSVTGQLKVYLSRVGMARFCTDEYRPPTRRNQDNAFMHLTNYSINKENTSSFMRSPDIHNTSNSKRLLKDVLEDLRAEGVDVDKVWQSIKDITVRTFVCLQPWLNLRYRHVYRGTKQHETSRCFQFLGLDILLDESDKCWLLEVNSNPSLRIDYFDSQYDGIDVQLESTMDRAIKEPAVSEALALASKLLLRPEKRKTKEAGDSASPASTSAAAKRSRGKGLNRSTPPVGKSGKAKAPNVLQKGKWADSQKNTPQQESVSKDFDPSSPTVPEKALSPTKDLSASSSSGTKRNGEVAVGSSSRRSASVSETRRLPENKRYMRRASSTDLCYGAEHHNEGLNKPSATTLGVLKNTSPVKNLADARQISEASSASTETTACSSRATGILASRWKKQSESQTSDELHGDVSDSEAGDGRASPQVDSELIDAAYKEIEKCMECFNVLGLRFQRSSMLPLKQTGNRWANGGCGSQTSEDIEMTSGRRGASRTRAHAPFRPFLRKDRNSAKKNALPVKSTYTKLHKDILKPIPEEELQPQGCWLSLEREAAALVEETKLVRRVQLLFERVTAFPRKIALERSRWMEVCDEVKLSEVIRRIQVAAAQQVRGSRGSTPQPPFSSFRPSMAPRPPQPSASRKIVRSGSICRSASTISVAADTPELSGAAGRIGGLVRQRSNAGGLSALSGGRKRRLTMADLETLFLQQMQQMRRQTQLQDSGRGLGLLEFAHMLKVLAVLCYPYLPPKASLVALFLSEPGSNPGGVLDHVVGEIEREQQVALSSGISSDGATSLISKNKIHESGAPGLPASKKQGIQDPATKRQVALEASEDHRKESDAAKRKKDPAAVKLTPEISTGNGSQQSGWEPPVCDTQELTEGSVAEPRSPTVASLKASDSKPAFVRPEEALQGIAARPATAVEEALTLLARRVAEGTSQLKVLDANLRHLEQHLQQLHELRQQQVSKHAALTRNRSMGPEALLRIANIDDIFGAHDRNWPREHLHSDTVALQALNKEIAACEAGIRSANHELQKTIQVRAAVASRHRQQEMELLHLRDQQRTVQLRQLEEEQHQNRSANQQLDGQLDHAATTAVSVAGCSKHDAASLESHVHITSGRGDSLVDLVLPSKSADTQDASSNGCNERKKCATKSDDSKSKRRTMSKNESVTELRSADRREHGNRSPQQVEVPEWHDILCAAWPDLNSQVLGVVPKGELKEAFQLLIDFFELRLDLYRCNTHQWVSQ